MPNIRNYDFLAKDKGTSKTKRLNPSITLNFINCINVMVNQDPELKEELYSLILFGSYVRGDFIK